MPNTFSMLGLMVIAMGAEPLVLYRYTTMPPIRCLTTPMFGGKRAG